MRTTKLEELQGKQVDRGSQGPRKPQAAAAVEAKAEGEGLPVSTTQDF